MNNNEQCIVSQDPLLEASSINNLAQLRQYIKLNLGAPVICVEISDEQLNNIIADTVRWIQKYYYDEGFFRDYLMLELQPGITHYKICQELAGVADLEVTSFMGSINELFTVPHNLLYDQVMNFNGQFTGQCWGNSSAYGDVLGSYSASLVWLKEVRNMFGEHFDCRYNEKEKELSVWPSPKRKTVALIKVYKKQDSFKIFQDSIFRRMVVAKSGIVWTNALRKYSLTISGGGTLNADSLYSSYKEEYDWCIDRIDKESPNGHCIAFG